jgi:hypothetical protein
VDANVVLTLLHTRVTAPAPGRFWMVADGAEVVGVVFQSPLTFFATLTPMSRKAVVAVVDVIADAGVDLPGVAAVSAGVLAAGRRCILYTDLGNPTSNSVYRRIGYRAVVECLRYRFT